MVETFVVCLYSGIILLTIHNSGVTSYSKAKIRRRTQKGRTNHICSYGTNQGNSLLFRKWINSISTQGWNPINYVGQIASKNILHFPESATRALVEHFHFASMIQFHLTATRLLPHCHPIPPTATPISMLFCQHCSSSHERVSDPIPPHYHPNSYTSTPTLLFVPERVSTSRLHSQYLPTTTQFHTSSPTLLFVPERVSTSRLHSQYLPTTT